MPVNSTGEPSEGGGLGQHASFTTGKVASRGESACHHSCCEGEYILIAMTDMQIQLIWIMPLHADTPHPRVETAADMCSWSHFLFFLGFIHLKVRL